MLSVCCRRPPCLQAWPLIPRQSSLRPTQPRRSATWWRRQSKLTWNAADSSGLASSGLTIEGVAVTDVAGPWAAATGLNYSWPYNSLAGRHLRVRHYSHRRRRQRIAIHRNAHGRQQHRPDDQQGCGVAGARRDHLERRGGRRRDKLQPHDRRRSRDERLRPLGGLFRREFMRACSARSPPAATRTSLPPPAPPAIRRNIRDGSWWARSTPTISNVVLSASQGVITWNAAAITGIASSTLTIDGAAVTNVTGPIGRFRRELWGLVRRACLRQPHVRHHRHQRRRP